MALAAIAAVAAAVAAVTAVAADPSGTRGSNGVAEVVSVAAVAAAIQSEEPTSKNGQRNRKLVVDRNQKGTGDMLHSGVICYMLPNCVFERRFL